MIRTARQICLWPLVLLAGCIPGSDRALEQAPILYQVKCGGDCLELNATTATDRFALVNKVAEHINAQRFATIDLVLERRLDVAVEALRRRDFKQAPTEAELTLARAADDRLHYPEGDGWFARLQGKGRGGLERAEDTLARAQEFGRQRQWTKARDLIQKNQTNLEPYSWHAIQAALLRAEAQRHAGQFPDAAQSWQRAARRAAELAARWQAPTLWEQIAAQRPIATAWPAEVTAAFLPVIPSSLHSLVRDEKAAEALVWFAIGNGRLLRSEAALALTAFKRADSQGALPAWDEFLCLYQAKALLGLDQTPSATSLLTTLTERLGSAWRLPALALLGSGKLREGQNQQALAFLRAAVEANDVDFPSRAEAEADLGLAYLSHGDETRGLSRLRAAQDRLRKEGQTEVLLTCLDNEAAYLQQAGRAAEARQVHVQIRQIQQTNVSITVTASQGP